MSGVVDRLLAQLPGLQGEAPSPRAISHQGASFGSSSSIHTVPPPMEDLLGPWARLLLGLALGTMMAWWPYPRTCGFPLAGYLTAVFTVVLGGGWAAVSAWRYRASLAHVLSLILVFYGMMLVAAEAVAPNRLRGGSGNLGVPGQWPRLVLVSLAEPSVDAQQQLKREVIA